MKDNQMVHEIIKSVDLRNLYVQWNLSITVTLGPDISGLYIQAAVIEKTCIRWSAAF